MNSTRLLSVMMFLEFFVWGAWYVTVGNYMGAHGMSDLIGWAYSVGPIAALLSPLFLGLVADRFFPTEKVLGIMQLLAGAAIIAAPMVVTGTTGENGTLFVGLLLLHMLCFMPTLGLTNTIAFHHITDQEKQFPIIRVFGTIGWIVAGIIVSGLLQADATAVPMYVAGGAAILMGVYSFFLPHTPPPMAGKDVSVSELLGLKAFQLMGRPAYAVFMISSLLICIPLAAYYAFAPVFVAASGAEKPAFLMSFGQMSEVGFMLVMPLFFKRLGVKWMLFVGMAAWVLRYGLFAAGAPDGVLWMIVGGILLHGICYDFFFVTGQIYTDKVSGPEIRGQAQGFLVLVTQGIGMLIGAQVSGALFGSYVTAEGPAALEQWQDFWILPCVAAAVIMVAFGVLFRDREAEQLAAVSESDVAAASLAEEGP